MRVNWNRVSLFAGLTLAGSYFVALLYCAAGGTWKLPDLPLVTAAYMLVPAAVAVLMQLLSFRSFGEALGLSFRLSGWFVVAWLLPPLLALATLPVSLVFPEVEYAGDLSGLFDRLQAAAPAGQLEWLRGLASVFPLLYLGTGLCLSLLAGPTSSAVFSLGEELGWRGFLQGELAPLGFWGASGVTGLVWGVWHAPVILFGPYYPEHPVAGVGMMTLFCILIAPLFSWVRLRSGSVFAAAVLHGSCNATGWLSVSLVRGGDDLTTGLLGWPGLIVLGLLNLTLLIHDLGFASPDRRLSRLACGTPAAPMLSRPPVPRRERP